MVEFHGAAMMAEEMESLTQAMIEGRVASDAEAQEVLMRAILQFPIYLEKVKTNRRDNPLIVLPLLNDLRTVRGESLLTETNLFSPYLAPAREVTGTRLPLLENRQQFQDAARKLRQMYQYAAAGFIRGVNADENLGYLQKVFARLHKLTSGTARQPLWHICLALAEALEIDAIESSVSIKNLLRQLDKELKQLVVHGTAPQEPPAGTELIKNLLYYVARSGKHAPGFAADSGLQQGYELYELDRASPEGNETGEEAQNMPAAPDYEAMRPVVAAVRVELDVINQAVDASLVSGGDLQAVADVLPVIKRIGDTMAVLGIADLRRQILEQGETIEQAVSAGGELAAHELMAVAGHMLDIEGRLDNIAAGVDEGSEGQQHDLNLSQAQESVLRESRTGLEQVKDAIIEYIASQWDQTHLAKVPDILRGIRGGLEMVPMPRPARLLGAAARYVEEQLLAPDASPEWDKLDTLADAITGVEYYLERFTSERTEEDELLLAVAEDSVAQLGYAVAKTPTPAEAIATESQDSPQDHAQEQEALSHAYQIALADSPETDELSVPEESNADAFEVQPGSTDEHEPEAGSVSDDTPMSESDDDDDFDEEILEIFVEEAGEVSDAIAEYFPQWAADFENQEALTEFRRAFHTLKGSGRMVGANDIGELAWSIENMLNRILDGTIAPGDQHVAAIEQVRRILPDMIEAFSNRQPNPHPELAQTYAAQADALSRGEAPADLAEAHEALSAPAAEMPSTDSGLLVEETDDDEEDEADSQLWEIFGIEALAHLQVVGQYISEMESVAPLFAPPSDSTQRALHTLKGSAHMADIQPIPEMVAPWERVIKELCTYQVNIDEDILQLLKDAVEYTTFALRDIEQGKPVEIPRLKQFEARVSELREIFVAPLVRQQEAAADGLEAVDPELLAIFMAEEMNLLLDADKTLDQWGAEPERMDLLQPMQAELVTLTNGARRAKQLPLAELSDKLHQVYQALMADQLQCSDTLCASLKEAHDALLDMVDAVAVGQGLKPEPEEITNALNALLAQAQATHRLKAEADADADAVAAAAAASASRAAA